LSAVALLIPATANSWTGNLSLWFSRAQVPIRLFTSEDKALGWLKSFPT